MKKILTVLILLCSLKSFAQKDTVINGTRITYYDFYVNASYPSNRNAAFLQHGKVTVEGDTIEILKFMMEDAIRVSNKYRKLDSLYRRTKNVRITTGKSH